MIEETAHIESEHVSKYLVVLCRHFARKVPATWDETNGLVTFPPGQAVFTVSDTKLTIVCGSDSEEGLDKVKDIVTSHVAMFSRRETIELQWMK
ncbi:DUF2218 domain-containing protein [uncultured Vibrio sp.]|uniref:DUF2218 domain-containing protein n=1 Tax=uncultured Vibrio sp. TaxID=114054 RepID=UPI0029C7C3A9|nr:DUF2218 domain-containing protein [uncultured Vibrio sp.]